MITIGAFEAKTHFSRILNDVEQGEEVVITRHGREIAIIKPIKAGVGGQSNVQRAQAAIRKMRTGVTLGDDVSIKELIDEGRK